MHKSFVEAEVILCNCFDPNLAEDAALEAQWNNCSITVEPSEEENNAILLIRGETTISMEEFESFLHSHMNMWTPQVVSWKAELLSSIKSKASKKPASPGLSSGVGADVEKKHSNSNSNSTKQNQGLESLKQTLPSYAHVLLNTDPEQLVNIIKTSPNHLEQILAAHALANNQQYQQTLSLNKKWESLQKDKEYFESLVEEAKRTEKILFKENPVQWHQEFFEMFFTNCDVDGLPSLAAVARNHFDDDDVLHYYRQILEALDMFLDNAKLIFEAERAGADPTDLEYTRDDLYREIDKAVEEFLQLLSQRGIETESEYDFDYSQLFLEPSARHLFTKHAELKETVSLRQNFASEIRRIAEIKDEAALLQKQKEKLKHFQKMPEFQKQDVEKIWHNVEQSKRPFALFMDGFFEDGIAYAIPEREIKEHVVQSKEGIFSLQSIKDGLAGNQDLLQTLVYQWQKASKEDRTKLSAVIGLSVDGSFALPRASRKVKISANLDWRETRQVLNQRLDQMLKIGGLENYQMPPALREAYLNVLQDWIIHHVPTSTVRHKVNGDKILVNINGKIQKQSDERIKQLLLRQGGQIEEHNMNLPDYKSWTDIHPGVVIKTKKGNVTINYVPFQASGLYNPKPKTAFSIEKSLPVIQQRIKKAYQPLSYSLEELMHIAFEDGDYKICPLTAQSLGGEHNLAMAKAALKNPNGKFHMHMPEGKEEYIEFSIRPLYQEESLIANEEALKARKDYAHRVAADAGWKTTGWGKLLSDKHHFQYQSAMQSARPWGLDQDIVFSGEHLDQWEQQSDSFKDLYQNGWVKPEDIEIVPFKEPVSSPGNAPLSERGRLWVEGAKTGEEALNALKDAGITKEFYPEVPYNMLSGSKHQISLPHADYMASPNTVALPEGHMPLHGLTGVQTQHEALDRLKKIVEAGGLYSIKSRRHMGIMANSLSPLGDIASGIDHGVPTTLGKTPYWGEHVAFVIKPSVLETRNVWFAPRDFGGGKNRSNAYTQYAWELGQKDYLDPPSHQSRMRHINRLGEGGDLEKDNEAYIGDGIALHQIDSILVSEKMDDIYDDLVEEMQRAKEAGLLPKDTEIKRFRHLDDFETERYVAQRWSNWHKAF